VIARTAQGLVAEALSDTPVVLIHGPRQSGKSTLARTVGDAGSFRHFNLDDAIPRNLATTDPEAFVASLHGPVIIDEVQRAPQLFLAMKSSVDRQRTPGRFLLTGSSNVLALPKLADSLAGRMAIVDLLPFSQSEIEGRDSGFIDAVFGEGPLPWDLPSIGTQPLIERLVRGGFPEASMRASAARRDGWFADYVRTLLERDVRDLANIEGLTQMPRVLSLIAARAGSTLNVVSLARDTGIPNTSLHRYLDLLKAVFLVHHIPAWSNDLGTRLTKSPKAYLVDTGLLCYLENVTANTLKNDPTRLALVLGNFVAMELKKLALASDLRPVLHHLRSVRQLEVDFVLEARGGGIVGIEVKAAPTVRPEDAEGLQFLKELAGDRFRRGIILYTGTEVQPLAHDITALPVDALWSL
jgi:hypothetical protein